MNIDNLAEKIRSKTATIGVMGLGYVGSAFAHLIAEKNFSVIGFDINKEKITKIKDKEIKNLSAETDMSLLKSCDIVIVCVQTPISKNKLHAEFTEK